MDDRDLMDRAGMDDWELNKEVLISGRSIHTLVPLLSVRSTHMSFSVDDLVSSLNASHIGQEAMDLAALQAQLTATLFPARSSRATASHHQANTPLVRTPSNSISMGSMSIDIAMSIRTSANSRRGSCSTPHHVLSHSKNDTAMSPSSSFHHFHHYHHHTSPFDDTVEEDERMVEDQLLPPPSTPISPCFHSEPTSATTSSFTTSDPFYLSQLQASQQAFTPAGQSVFAQNGRITQGSQFALQTAF